MEKSEKWRVSWDSPWGKGRQAGISSALSWQQKHLGDTIDIHGGGQDLEFPHHENEIAQSEAKQARNLPIIGCTMAS